MKILLVVFTTLAVFLALSWCCFVAVGDHSITEGPGTYLTILITK